jgi:cation-transporting ATPase 13A3/4/5
VEITQNLEIPADMILLDGTCVINETMLTGETTPVIKTAVPRRSKVKISNQNNQINLKRICLRNTIYFLGRFVCIRRQ